MRPMRLNWDELWMDVADVIAQRSLCDRDRVGAVVVSSTNRILDTGYNGPPAGFTREPDDRMSSELPCRAWCERGQFPVGTPLSETYADCPSLHAEANALMFSDRRLREGGTIYVSSGTCDACAKLVANSGLVRAVYAPSRRADGAAHRDSDRWYDFLRSCGLEVVVVESRRR